MSDATFSDHHSRPIRIWLWSVAVLVFIMVLVGGATRLTESGLSITEWKPLLGAFPPLNDADWAREFALYQSSPQYELMNKGMALADFKVIYWWEWGHRQLGRLIGAAMLLPWLYFVFTGRLRGRLAWQTFALGLFIGLQGAIGWIMVASGLKPGMTAVAPVKLMLHLVCAALIFVWLIWLAMRLSQARQAPQTALRGGALLVLVLVVVQIALGALVAGNHAGLAYNTWPLMDGGFAPSYEALFARPVWLENFVDNTALVQFNHRLVAYGVLAVAFWHYRVARCFGGSDARRTLALLGLVLVQVVLGIWTLLWVVPLHLALVHQGAAMLIAGMATVHLARVTPEPQG